ncbi:tetratricopeptide repeat protein [Roseovarius aestuariivivens]|uniref:tetratricopeptide repeat protein n=1 Tax=Roseovarius aestuariivivens TaxID=1888910 RepID=UPI001080D579|nr:tetratricopeptide repeat protein [Roseovarius aestuariivivens]
MHDDILDVRDIDALIASHRLNEALAALKAALAAQPRHLPFVTKQAEILRRLGRPAVAVALLKGALEKAPDALALRDALATCLRQSGKSTQSLAVCEETLALHPGHIPAVMARIDALIAAYRLDEALVAAKAARAAQPRHLPFTAKEAEVLRRLARPVEAVVLLERALEKTPGELVLRDALATCLRQSGESARSLAVSEATLALDPGHIPAAMARIDALIASHRLQEALAAVQAARAEKAGHLPFVAKQAEVLRRLGRPADAVALLERALEKAPDALALRDALAICLRQTGETARSLALSEETLASFPEHRPAAMARVDALIALGDQAGLEELAASIMAEPATGKHDPSKHVSDALILVRVLSALRSDNEVQLLKDAAGRLNSAARILPPDALWRIYLRADQLGFGASYRALLSDLLGRDRLPLGVCIGITEELYRNGSAEWQRIAARLKHHLTPLEHWHFRLVCIEIAEGAEAALTARRTGHRQGKPQETLLLQRLLMLTGRLRLASRYLRRACRRWPWHPGIFQAYLSMLIRAGALEELHSALHGDRPPSLDFRIAAACAWSEIGDLPAAEAIIHGIKDRQQRNRLDLILLSHYLRRGEIDRADTLSERVREALPRRSVLQSGPTINGLLQFDVELARRDGKSADARTYLSQAGAEIETWCRANPDGGSQARSDVPPQVMQYWDAPQPPDDIAALIEGWRQAPGVAHHRADRREAMTWLEAQLGLDWVKALRAARSPAEQSDYFRLAWLMLEGGLYVDCDDRLIGDLQSVFSKTRGLTVFIEPRGAISNNIVFAPPMHPAIVWAAHAARRALLERHSDNTWLKTGPGLLTRAVAWYLKEGTEGPRDIRILPRHVLGSWVQVHVPLPYKRTSNYWNAAERGAGSTATLLELAPSLLKGGPAPAA